MSLIQSVGKYEKLAKQYTLNQLTAQFSGVLVVDYDKQITGGIEYIINDSVVAFDELDYSDSNTIINTRKVVRRCWALPGIIISETVKGGDISPNITLPTLPFGFVNSDPGDILVLTTIPKYWYPEVPDGDRLNNYELSFTKPFFEVKNNRQFFKVKQHNVLEEGVIVLQLSSLPLQNVDNSQITSSTGQPAIIFN